MLVTVKFFGALREAVGADSLALELESKTSVAGLRAELARKYSVFADYGARLRAAVNQEFATEERELRDRDEIAFLPPVSGGAGRCSISSAPLDVEAVVKRVNGPDIGGIVTFLGAVRNEARGHDIDHLEYEAYAAMAERELDQIVAEAEARWPGARVAVAHRVGRLAIGDLAVVVVGAAPHRGEAFEACRYTIDTLKTRVPIWKKEFASDGAYWVDDHA